MIKALAHICIEAEDLEKAQWFYCEVLGFTKKFDFIKEGDKFGFYLQINESNFIEVFKAGESQETAQRPRIKHFCLEVEDIDAVEMRLAQHGVETRGKKIGADNSWQLWCKDPTGIDMEFHQYTETSSQITGADCIVNW
jgi:lactoylglutathione lyase/glyoxylase I family protein